MSVCWINGNRNKERVSGDFKTVVGGNKLRLKIAISGAPASGKGTQAVEIKNRFLFFLLIDNLLIMID